LALTIDEKPLLDIVIDRFRACGDFSPVFVAGPRRLLGAVHNGAEVIDTDSSFGANLEAAIDHVQAIMRGPKAFTTCDIIPSVDELTRLMADYRAHEPLDFWLPVIAAPEAEKLGTSSWKPRYRVIPTGSSEAVSILPCHLVIADPGVFRLGLVYRSFQLAYETRNTRVLYRLRRILLGVSSYLLRTDLAALRRGRWPTTTVSVAFYSVALGLALRGKARQEDLERYLERIFVEPSSRRIERRGGRIPLATGLSLARDIDTREEAEELTGH
jgi:hypothetical protein